MLVDLPGVAVQTHGNSEHNSEKDLPGFEIDTRKGASGERFGRVLLPLQFEPQ